MSSQALGFVHQLVTENSRIIAVHHAGYAVAPGNDFFDMFAIQAAGSLVRIEQHRLFLVDTVRVLVVIGAVDAGPSQVLCDAAGVAPPICQTELHAQSVARGFRNHAIEKNKLVFVPFAWLEPKIMYPWPVIDVSDGLDVIRPTFARRPHAHDLDAQAG